MGISDDTVVLAERLSDQFARIMFRCMSERLVEELTAAEVTYPQLQVLHYVSRHSHVSVGDVAAGLDISYPSATNMIQRLGKKGLICKTEDPRDRRAVNITLSEKGARVVNWLDRERSTRFALILDKMEPAERQAFYCALGRFVCSAIDADIASPDELCLRCGQDRVDGCVVREREGNDFCK
ncbi:MAG: winged helix-turn-helix transcriptional regulator [Fimbriimonadia bacterium]|jgi:DNA-binding MarR family transcriptional regulator